MIEKLACNLERNDEVPNIELAKLLCNNNDRDGIKEIVCGLKGKNKAVANDCIKVLYEVGTRKPNLIAEYADTFLDLLISRNNRIAWGCMTALAAIADLSCGIIIKRLETVKQAYHSGSVITIDNSMTVFAKLCLSDRRNEDEIFPLLIEHFKNCRSKEIPQHIERISICLNKENSENIIDVINNRFGELNAAQLKRVNKILKNYL